MGKSLKDIAEALNMSKATVSWVLSGKGKARGFNEDTIKLVQEYAVKIGYRPNLLARSLSVGASNTLGLIIPFIGDTFYAQLAQAIEGEAERSNYLVTICSSEGSSAKEIELIKTLRSKQVDGLIIAPTKDSAPEIEQLKADRFPFVLIDRYFPQIDSNYIVVNNESSSYEVVSELAKRGSKKIALLTSDTQLFVMGLRLNGYQQALKETNTAPNEELIVKINRSDYKNDIFGKLDNLFENHPDVDGIYFTTHYLALESIRYFITRNIDYKHRFRLGCFHEMEALEVLAPEMLISRMPIGDIGKYAVEILLGCVNDKNREPKGLVLENSLTI